MASEMVTFVFRLETKGNAEKTVLQKILYSF